MEVGGIDEETANDQNGLVVRLRRIGQRSEVSRLVDEADFHPRPESGYGHQMVAIGSAAHDGVGTSEFLYVRRRCSYMTTCVSGGLP